MPETDYAALLGSDLTKPAKASQGRPDRDWVSFQQRKVPSLAPSRVHLSAAPPLDPICARPFVAVPKTRAREMAL